MSTDVDVRSKKRAFTVFVGCCLMQAIGLGTVLNSSSAFFAVVPVSLGLGMAEFAIWLSSYSFAALVATAIAGTLYTKFDAKIVVSASVIVSAISVYCFSLATQSWHFLAIGVVLGLSGGLYFLYACPVLMNAWFAKKKGTYLGIANIFSGIGGALWPLAFTALFGAIGYQNVYLLNAILILVCILPFSLTVFTLKPEKAGLHAYGAEDMQAEAQAVDVKPKVPLGRVVGSVAFVLCFVACAFMAFPGSYNSYMQAYVVDVLGSDFLVTSATIMIVLQIGYIISSIATGALADRFGIKPVAAGVFAITIVAYIAFTFAQSFEMMLVVAFFFGMNNCTVVIVVPMLVRELFGSMHYEKLLGYCMAGCGLVGGNSAPIIGLFFDMTGNYNMGFMVGAGVALVVCVLMFAAYPAAKALRKKLGMNNGNEALSEDAVVSVG